VAAGAGDGDAEAEAAEGAGDDGGAAAAFKRDGGGDAVAIGAALEEVTHAAEVAFALFAYVGGEENWMGGAMLAYCRAAAMARRAVRPAALSQMPGA